MDAEFVNSFLNNWLILSIGTKGSGKTYLMLKYLKFALKNDLYDQYVLVLPMFTMEQNNSYKFINAKDKRIYVFESYNEVITANLLKQQEKDKVKKKVLFIIDDASGENVFRIDPSLQHMITSIRHYNIGCWMLIHSTSNILSPFIRQQCDLLLLYKITNYKLLKNIYEEFLSLMEDYTGNNGHKFFIDKVINVQKEKYQCIYMNIRTGSIDYNVKKWNFENLTSEIINE